MPASALKSNGQLPAGAVLRAPVHSCTAEGANHGLLVTRGTERFIDDTAAVSIHVLEDERAAAILFIGSTTEPSPVTAPQVSETGIAAKRFAEESMFVLDAESGTVVETLPFSGQKKRPRSNSDLGRSDVRDSSPHARLLRQARSRVQELVTANRRKDEFLAMLSHELRSPLAAIQNAVCLLSSHGGEAPVRQRAQALIERQVRGMTQLVDDLKDVSRIRHGRMQLQRERIELRGVVRNAIETLEADIDERNQRLTSALPDAPVWLQADPWRLEQVFVNLLANASRYTNAGGVLEVRMHSRDGQAVVGIRDSGMGIAPDALPHIFDLFRQADEAASCSRSGLGIGLALARNLVELHGGSVTAASAGIGQGSEFTVRLPHEALKTAGTEAQTYETEGSRST
jgi:signal transduction histidine kinase